MQNNRASIFAPFDALIGFREALRIVEKQVEDKKDLSEDIFDNLNKKILKLKKGDYVTINYFFIDEYIETSGYIKKIDIVNKMIYLLNTKISFEDILNIS